MPKSPHQRTLYQQGGMRPTSRSSTRTTATPGMTANEETEGNGGSGEAKTDEKDEDEGVGSPGARRKRGARTEPKAEWGQQTGQEIGFHHSCVKRCHSRRNASAGPRSASGVKKRRVFIHKSRGFKNYHFHGSATILTGREPGLKSRCSKWFTRFWTYSERLITARVGYVLERKQCRSYGRYLCLHLTRPSHKGLIHQTLEDSYSKT